QETKTRNSHPQCPSKAETADCPANESTRVRLGRWLRRKLCDFRRVIPPPNPGLKTRYPGAEELSKSRARPEVFPGRSTRTLRPEWQSQIASTESIAGSRVFEGAARRPAPLLPSALRD